MSQNIVWEISNNKKRAYSVPQLLEIFKEFAAGLADRFCISAGRDAAPLAIGIDHPSWRPVNDFLAVRREPLLNNKLEIRYKDQDGRYGVLFAGRCSEELTWERACAYAGRPYEPPPAWVWGFRPTPQAGRPSADILTFPGLKK